MWPRRLSRPQPPPCSDRVAEGGEQRRPPAVPRASRHLPSSYTQRRDKKEDIQAPLGGGPEGGPKLRVPGGHTAFKAALEPGPQLKAHLVVGSGQPLPAQPPVHPGTADSRCLHSVTSRSLWGLPQIGLPSAPIRCFSSSLKHPGNCI